MKNTEFLLNDLAENGPHSGWDWPADLRFAHHINDTDCLELLDNGGIDRLGGTILAWSKTLYHTHCKRTHCARLRGLRQLAKRGLVESFWVGLGEGSTSLWGIRRDRHYRLKKEEPSHEDS